MARRVRLWRTCLNNRGTAATVLDHLLPINVSTFGGDIDHVFWLIFWIVGLWFIAAECILLYSVMRHRRKAGAVAAFWRGDTPRQLAWVLIPAFVVLCLDLGIDYAGASVWERVKGNAPASNIVVRVTAKQFNWIFTYPGPDNKFGTADDVTSENDMHVPVGKVVHLELESPDVIHSFFVPNLRLKQDVVPGRTIRAWFEATKAGTYEIACSELCGFGHYSMQGNVIVQNQAAYAAWVRETWPRSTAASSSASSKN
ncbi:MAG: cupredoxin domain-containing protein [Candidatus Binatus sp.]|uniref:cytochrome c oxidase subunit II n=1 Tax=Candidatus Binatus sp. TaxID=2811406 RepID=UPI002722519F|nr:cupredoxin domain-containing protein [Candidatus Binatus sp.]MDO8433364.1 cupredoxin domain-containing protein [Candidatus Binatus sp.]